MSGFTYRKSKVSRPYSSNLNKYKDDDGNIIERFFDVVTPYGIVDVTGLRYGGFGTATILRFTHGGYQHERRYDGKFYSVRYAVTLANDFAVDLLGH